MTTGRPGVREIITKAVCGAGTYNYQRSIDLELPIGHKTIQVLGNYVSNAALVEAVAVDRPKLGKAVQIKGHYDVHVWYAYDQDTQAAKTTVTFIEYIPMQMYGGESISNQQAFAKITQKPCCTKAYVKNLGNKTVIRVEITQNLAAEIVGHTKLKVGVSSAALAATIPVTGQELVPPEISAHQKPNVPAPNYYLDFKSEEDIPDEDDEDYEYSQDEFNG
ncbi:MAG: outer spore coat protein CotE [Thermincola sp.]|jgi:spore coat protein E|nr:outer spore coat protein CotE [Thermincola sp.]MDT3703954.1 outer spore coat protein CotE [Thermincola sp.]